MSSVPYGGGVPNCHGIGPLGRGIGLAFLKYGRETGDDGPTKLSASTAVESRELKASVGTAWPVGTSGVEASLLSTAMGVFFALMATHSDILAN